MSARYYYSIFVRHILWKRILPYGKNNCCSLVARLSLPRFIDVSSISHYPNRNGGNNNRTSILNRARIILVSPSLIARSRFAALRFPPSLSIVDELSGMFLNRRATCNTSDVSDFFFVSRNGNYSEGLNEGPFEIVPLFPFTLSFSRTFNFAPSF